MTTNLSKGLKDKIVVSTQFFMSSEQSTILWKMKTEIIHWIFNIYYEYIATNRRKTWNGLVKDAVELWQRIIYTRLPKTLLALYSSQITGRAVLTVPATSAWSLQHPHKKMRIFDDFFWSSLNLLTCHNLSQSDLTVRLKEEVWQLLCFLQIWERRLCCWAMTSFFASMIIKSMNASPDVITLFCLCWHIEGWNIVIGMHYHPSLNWDQSQGGLCKCTLIWESVCPGQNQQCQEAGWEAFTQSQESLAPTAQNMCWSRCWSCFAFLLLTVFIIRLEIVKVIGWYVSRLTLLVQSSFSPLLIYKFGVMDHFKNNHNAYQSSNDHSHLHNSLKAASQMC